MYIIIVGGGRVGYYLSKALLNEGHEVLVIERDAARCDRIADELGNICLRGDGCEISILSNVGVERADLFVAVTGGDEDNLVACQIAKHKFHVRRTIARMSNPRNEALFKKLGIDVTISSTNLILEHIQEEVPTHPLMHLMTLSEEGLEVVEVRITAGSETIGKRLKDLKLPEGSSLSLLLRRGDKPQVPGAEIVLRAEDRLLAVTRPDAEQSLRSALTGK